MNILFVNIGPSFKNNENNRVYTSVKFWRFFREIKKHGNILHYVGPVKIVGSNLLADCYEVDALCIELPFFFRIRGFMLNCLNPFFLIELYKGIANIKWDDVDLIYLRDTHPISAIIYFIGLWKNKKLVLHITANPRQIAQSSFSGLKKYVYIGYAYIREMFEWFVSKKSLVLLSGKHPHINPDNRKSFYINTCLVSRRERVNAAFIKNKYNTPATRTILFIGRLSTEKGVDILINAYRKVYRKYPDSKLTIIGDGPERAKLESEASDLISQGVCKFVGHISEQKDLLHYLRESYMLAIPSRSDGLPKILLESLHCGIAIVASRTGRIPEIVDDDKAILVSPGNTDEISEAISYYFCNPDIAKKHAINAFIEGEKYTMEAELSRINKILNQ